MDAVYCAARKSGSVSVRLPFPFLPCAACAWACFLNHSCCAASSSACKSYSPSRSSDAPSASSSACALATVSRTAASFRASCSVARAWRSASTTRAGSGRAALSRSVMRARVLPASLIASFSPERSWRGAVTVSRTSGARTRCVVCCSAIFLTRGCSWSRSTARASLSRSMCSAMRDFCSMRATASRSARDGMGVILVPRMAASFASRLRVMPSSYSRRFSRCWMRFCSSARCAGSVALCSAACAVCIFFSMLRSATALRLLAFRRVSVSRCCLASRLSSAFLTFCRSCASRACSLCSR